MLSEAQASSSTASTEVVMSSVVGGLQWGVDRMLAVGYGVLYDYIFAKFPPYRQLTAEVVELLGSTVPAEASRRDVHVLDVACGPGNLTVTLAEAGFSVTGVDPYAALVEVAREKRRAQRLSNVAFRHAEFVRGGAFKAASFDRLVNVHSLYLHPHPEGLLREAFRVLKPGGYAVFVNRMRPVNDWATVRELKARDGVPAALRSLLWVVPNSIFEAARKRSGGPHYWDEPTFAGALEGAGFTMLSLRRTFLHGSSLLAFVRKDGEG
jgi:2-polyprenyl-3-methyl-5-hydroxy-6-metoxy-1,4-benzoquinol methylase